MEVATSSKKPGLSSPFVNFASFPGRYAFLPAGEIEVYPSFAPAYTQGQPWYRCLPCGKWVKGAPLWEERRRGMKEMLLDPGRLVPAVKAQLDSGQSIAYLEEELKSNRQRLDMLNDAEQKALRLHLYLPNYPLEKLQAETQRIEEQRQNLSLERAGLERQLADLRQAMVSA